MRLLLEYSAEHPTLPHAEMLAALGALGLRAETREGGYRLALVEVTGGKRPRILDAVRRTAFTFTAMEHLFSCPPSPETIRRAAAQHPLPKRAAFAARAREVDISAPTPLHPTYKHEARSGRQLLLLSPTRVEGILGEAYAAANPVNLEHPEQVVRALLLPDAVHVGLVAWESDRSAFESRRVQFRPAFAPVSMHPKLARAAANLAGVPPGGVLYDPFCGTGGLLLEAGLLDCRVLGSDIDERMVHGAKRTLEHYKVHGADLFPCDVGDAPRAVAERMASGRVDGIATDLPYGRSASLHAEKPESLYPRAFRAFAQLLKPGGRAVVGLPNEKALRYGEEASLALEADFPYRVHRSLTRHFAVYRAPRRA